MKRSDELAVLSREHHVALELALRLLRATEDDVPAVTASALEFWRTEGREHFRLEEELLLPAFARHAAPDDPDVVRVLVDHLEFRRRIADLEHGAGTDEVNALGKLLQDHVRHEERTLFPRIEAALDGEELATVGSALQAAGSARRPPRA